MFGVLRGVGLWGRRGGVDGVRRVFLRGGMVKATSNMSFKGMYMVI